MALTSFSFTTPSDLAIHYGFARPLTRAPMQKLTHQQAWRAAADLIERDGWFQGSLQGPNGGRCAYGALVFVTRHGEMDCPHRHATALERQLSLPAGPAYQYFGHTMTGLRPLAYWNDQPGRTKEEVVAMFRTAADARDLHEAAERAANEAVAAELRKLVARTALPVPQPELVTA